MTYDIVKCAVEQAGFFASHDRDGHRLVCASLSRIDGGLTGNSFWISQRPSGWFLGTWGPHLYRIPNPERVPELCTSWLRRQPRSTAPDVDDHIRGEFGLVELEDMPDE